ncbi:hypothetical protein T484DRAFT_1799793 [Baffinella frigidus]|nr:hypothetical protein T484DRAFT_1799793 [Cryptophyta sp. CCMP2293]
MEEDGRGRAGGGLAGGDGEKERDTVDDLMDGNDPFSPERAGGVAGRGDGDADVVDMQAAHAKKPRLKFGFGLIREGSGPQLIPAPEKKPQPAVEEPPEEAPPAPDAAQPDVSPAHHPGSSGGDDRHRPPPAAASPSRSADAWAPGAGEDGPAAAAGGARGEKHHHLPPDTRGDAGHPRGERLDMEEERERARGGVRGQGAGSHPEEDGDGGEAAEPYRFARKRKLAGSPAVGA